MKRPDIRMIERAFRNQWDMDPSLRADLIEQLRRIVADPETKPRTVAAARAALAAAGEAEAP